MRYSSRSLHDPGSVLVFRRESLFERSLPDYRLVGGSQFSPYERAPLELAHFRRGILDNALKNKLGDATGCVADFHEVDIVLCQSARLWFWPLKYIDVIGLLHWLHDVIGVIHLNHDMFKECLFPHPNRALGFKIACGFVVKMSRETVDLVCLPN